MVDKARQKGVFTAFEGCVNVGFLKIGERSFFEGNAMSAETDTFAERLRKKMRMDRLARQVYAQPGPADGPGKIDREAMRLLLAETDRKIDRKSVV